MTISVDEPDSAVSSDRNLHSADLKETHAILVQNFQTGEALLLPVYEVAYLGLSDAQKDAAQAFLDKPGEKMAVRITGGESYTYDSQPEHEAKSQMQKMGFVFTKDIDVKSGEEKWQLLYTPQTYMLLVSTKSGRTLYENRLFKNFQKYVDRHRDDRSR